MKYRTRRDISTIAREAIRRDDLFLDLSISSRVFVEQFANMQQKEREAWVQIQATADSITKSGAPVQRMRIKNLKAEVEDFLTTSFSAANLQDCDIVTQNKHLTRILLNQYPLMRKPVAALEAHAFCNHRIIER